MGSLYPTRRYDAQDGDDPAPVASTRVQRWIDRQARIGSGVLSSSADVMVRAMPQHIRLLWQGETEALTEYTVSRACFRGWKYARTYRGQGTREMARRVRHGEAAPATPRQASVF